MSIERFVVLAEAVAFEDGEFVFELVVQQLLVMKPLFVFHRLSKQLRRELAQLVGIETFEIGRCCHGWHTARFHRPW